MGRMPMLLPCQKGANIMVRVPADREPTHPGEMLCEEFLRPMGITQKALADAIHVPCYVESQVTVGMVASNGA
jgi:hypothetical protein